MEIIKAINHRKNIIALLSSEKLPTDDLPSSLDNFLVMTGDNELVGVIGLEMHGDYGLLRSLAVNPDYRSKNIAGKLVEEIEKFAVSKD